jgi:hypothetical protein
MQQVIQTGAGVKLLINGIVVGFATGISFTRGINTKEIYGIDSPLPQEIIATTYSVRGTLTGLRVRDSGGLDGYGIMDISDLSRYFNFKYSTIEVVDRATSKTIYTIQKCVFDQDSWNIQARAPITFSANFKGVFVTNEVTGK